MVLNIAVMHANGRTGRRIARSLLQAGARVTALGRSRERMADLEALGATVHAGDPHDAAWLTSALEGVDTVYGLLPYDVSVPGYLATQRRLGVAMATAVRNAGIRRLVFLSSVGAELPEGTGMLGSLHEQEQRLRALPGTHTLMLRAGAFMENLHGVMPLVRELGIVADAVEPDLALPMVASRDIADAAVRALLDPSWSGSVVREVLGPRDISFNEVARILAVRTGTESLSYVQMPYGEYEATLAQAGFAADTAALTTELARAINARRVQSRLGRTADSTTPTGFEEFSAELTAV
ncbi:NAD(P)H-binding protein [soil metagenome]